MKEALRAGSVVGFAAFAFLAVSFGSTESIWATIGAAVVYGLTFLGR